MWPFNLIIDWIDSWFDPPVSKITKTFEKTSKRLGNAAVRKKIRARDNRMRADTLQILADQKEAEAKRASSISTKLKELVS